jgi:DNA-binding NarL/FixJ family response regulator
MKKILVIEDQPLMRRNLVIILQREGFEAAAAPNGRIGVEMAQSDPPDLVLCDIMMPELDGYGVLDALRANSRTADVPFIFLTAKGERIDQRTGMSCGADDYLTKPVVKDELLGTINARLARREHTRKCMEDRISELSFKPDFSSSLPLEGLGLSPREAEVLFWIAQGKANADVGTVLNMSELTVKKHAGRIFEKLGVESRHAATLKALEVLSIPAPRLS